MKTLTAQDAETKSPDIVAENIARLTALFPEALTEGKLDFDVLKQLLGGAVDEREEKYGLNWHGKRRARQLALTPSTGTLRPCLQDSVDWDTTRNLMIEGDNLEVLKLLQKSYAGKVKLIYIDPPYNTGKDFVYPDNFQDNIKNYLQLTGQVDGNGNKICSNTEASGRFHTDWLNMMYPRLKLARNLLRDDGMIAVSIDDAEVGNLRRALDEVFGEEQFQAQVVVQSNKRGQTYKQIAKTHEFLVIYSKSEDLELNELEKAADALPFTDSSGAFDLWELRNRNPKFGRFNRPNLFFPIYVLTGSIDECGYSRVSLVPADNASVKVLPLNSEGEEGCWRWGTDKIKGCDLNAGSPVLVARKRRDGEWNIYEKSRKSTTKVKSIWSDTDFINEQGTIELGRLDMGDVFDHPKPVALLQRCIFMATGPDDVVMDVFAGSGTMGHATLAQNAADGGKRRYILVQLPEPLDPNEREQKTAADFCDHLGKPRNIAELTKERLRRAGKQLQDDNPLFKGADVGFRVLKLASSNIRAWEPNRDDLPKTLEESIEHLKTDRTEQDILFELLLKLGLDLTIPIERENIAGKTVHNIGAGTLLVCLAEQIAVAEVEPLALGIVAWHKQLNPAGETTVVFRDSAFADDVAKTNLTAILQQHGLENVRSI
jgi:adenine-specific DNA-methyltransferase